MPLPSDVIRLSQENCSWVSFSLAFYTCIRCTHDELLAGVLDETWDILTAALHDIDDDGARASWLFYCWQPRSMPLAQILAYSRNMAADAIIAAVLEDPRYPSDRMFLDMRRRAMSFVAALAKVEISAVSYDRQCPVCRAGFEETVPEDRDHTVRKTPYGHLYGHDCLVEALTVAINNPCPLCRRNLSKMGIWSFSSYPVKAGAMGAQSPDCSLFQECFKWLCIFC
jgi:hypothetical protein